MRVLVTGANRGLGLEFVRQYLKRGERVAAGCRAPGEADALQKLRKRYPDNLLILRLDVTQKRLRESVYNRVKKEFGGLDLLINNAGIRSGGEEDSYTLGELHEEDILKVFKVNAVSPLMMVEQLVDLLAEGDNPRIVNITSFLGSIESKSWVFRYSYCASKAALNMFSKMLSLELEEQEIIVVALHPGYVRTSLGGRNAPLSPRQSIEGMIKVIDSLTMEDTGRFLGWDGGEVPW
jgi:NAD(P)-dependent dehydrogenase (short-subunit alcohol dehydrogenase family)